MGWNSWFVKSGTFFFILKHKSLKVGSGVIFTKIIVIIKEKWLDCAQKFSAGL